MKKFIYLLLIPLCMGFVACGGDDEEEQQQQQQQQQETKNPLVGTWERVEKFNVTLESGYKCSCTYTYTYTFKNDGKYEYVRNETVTSEKAEENSNESSYAKGNYAYDSTTRTLSIVSDEGKSQSFTVLTLKDNILTIMEYDGDQLTFSKKN